MMSLIEGVGDEVTNFLVIVISSIIIYLAWRSTNVRDERIPRAVLIIESNRRRLLDRVAQHPVTISIRKISPLTQDFDFNYHLHYSSKRITAIEPISIHD